MTALRQLAAIVAKDLLIEWRTRDLLATMLALGFTSLVLFNFAVDFRQVSFRSVGPPVLWMAFLFTAVVGLTRSFAVERSNGCMDGLLLSPADRGVLYAGKLTVNFLVLLALQVFLVTVGFLLLNQGVEPVSLDPGRWAALSGVVALTALGFAAVGTLFALVAQGTRRGDLLLPVLQSILGLPLLVTAVLATRRLFDPTRPLADVGELVRLLVAYDVVFACVALLLFETVVEE